MPGLVIKILGILRLKKYKSARNLLNTAQEIPCLFLKMSEQIVYGSQKLPSFVLPHSSSRSSHQIKLYDIT